MVKTSSEQPKKIKTKPSSEDLLKEIHALHKSIESLNEDIKQLQPPKTWKQYFHHFLIGGAKGLGFLFATTIIATILVYLAQQALRAPEVQEWLQTHISEFVQEIATETTDAMADRLLH